MIPYGRQEVTPADVAAIMEVLQSEFLTQGPKIPEFEQAVASKVDARHAVATNSATSALHISYQALGLGPGDHLWTSPISYVATANAALYCGARVDFVDIEPRTYNISVAALESKLHAAAATGTLPKIVVPVHLGGQACDMQAINALAKQFGFAIVEDASHAIGGKYRSNYIGSCQYSDITVFSFHPVKIITTAEGGMATTNSANLARRMQRLRSHGVTREPAEMTHEPDGPWYYQQIELGYNYRLSEMQAALGLSQIERLDQYVERRRELAANYDDALDGLPLTTQWQHPDAYSAYHLYIFRLEEDIAGTGRRQLFEFLRRQGVGVNVHYIPIHTQPWYLRLGFGVGDYPEAEAYYREAISLPLFPSLTDDDQATVINALRKAIGS